jgi:hypothetical protein
MFKQRQKKNKPVRKRHFEEDDTAGEDEGLSLEELKELREDQKTRERKKLASGLKAVPSNKSDVVPETSVSTIESSDDSKLLNMLGGQFTAQTKVSKDDQYAEII